MPALDHHILVVEDDAGLRDALCELLLDEGMLVSCAENGQVGLELLRAGARPCLILLDLQMPFLDGFGFRRQQLADPDLADIPAVVMTAQTARESEARRLGISLTLRKPVAPDRILGAIAEVCSHAARPRTSFAG